MSFVLAILPESIGGRLTTSSIIDGFKLNGFKVDIFDELNPSKILNFKDYRYIIGYDFSPVKFKIENNLKTPCIAYFSDVIQDKTAGIGYKEYYKNLFDKDVFVFYWDRVLAKKENWNYQAHFVNTEIYKNFLKPKYDVSFMGRLDTDLRLNTFIELNKKLPNLSFKWYAIEKHYKDALKRAKNDKDIIKKAYCGFIDNEIDMAQKINETKIVYNINAQGISSLNYRTFQVMAAERLLISDIREELDLFDNILPTYETIDELAQKINYYLKNDEEYEKIVKKSREFIKLNHDSRICVKKMIEVIENLET